MQPLVSILIPAFNSAMWIASTLESALSQTWANTEIIVVDDGSSDDTLAVARRYASKKLTVVTQANQGAAAARNTGFSMSNGEYIQWLDADDLLAPTKVEMQMSALLKCENSRTVASGPWAYFLYRPRLATFSPTPLWCDLTPTEWLLQKMGQNLHMQTATWLVSRATTAAAGPWNTHLSVDDDGEYFCRVLLHSDQVKFVPQAKVYYRATGTGSLSHIGRSTAKIAAQLDSMRLHIGYLRSLEDSTRVRAACVQYLQNWLITFYPEHPDIMDRAERMATELGGHLEPPEFSWKYAWLETLGGPGLAKRAQALARTARWSAGRSWDRVLFEIERVSRVRQRNGDVV